MDTPAVTLELPASLYAELQAMAAEGQTGPVEVIARLVTLAQQRRATSSDHDPIFDLIGAYHSHRPLIDDIPVSEDPDLYLVAERFGDQATGMHAWDLAPDRYVQDQHGRPIRKADERKP